MLVENLRGGEGKTRMTKSQDDKIAFKVLTFLGEMYEQLAAFHRYLSWENAGTLPPVRKVQSDVVCRNYMSGLTVAIWLEAELGDDASLAWWLDVIRQEEGWLLDGRIYSDGQDGQDTIFEIPPLVVEDFHTVQQKAPVMLEELFKAGKQVLTKKLASIAS